VRTRRPIRDAVSAGGVVWRRGDDGLEVVACRREAEDLWCLPKGTPEPDESMLETALREVSEETGLQVESGEEKLDTIEYWFARDGIRVHKRVYYWLMTAVGGSLDDHDHEFDRVAWLTIDDARQLLTYENEREILSAAVAATGSAT
jgi:8-oxo-dGTP pyrophosphatase MutT (NUDIX family)